MEDKEQQREILKRVAELVAMDKLKDRQAAFKRLEYSVCELYQPLLPGFVEVTE